MEQTSSEKQQPKTKHVRIRFPEGAHGEIVSALKTYFKRVGVRMSFNSFVVAACVEKARSEKSNRPGA